MDKAYDIVEKLAPTGGALGMFMKLTEGGELCPRFRFFAFCSGLGAMMQRRVVLIRDSILLPPLYPNPWIVLLAPPARGHKSTTLSMVRNVLFELDQDKRPRFVLGKITPEALVKALAGPSVDLESGTVAIVKDATAYILSSEFGVFLGKERYNIGMVPLLTDLYDCPKEWVSETVGRGKIRLFNVCISMLAASTPEWMHYVLPQDTFAGGFLSRLLLVVMPPDWRVRVPLPKPADPELLSKLRSELEVLLEMEGEMRLTPEASEYFCWWYEHLPEPPTTAAALYLERKQDNLLKISMLLAINDKRMVVEKRDIELASNILDAIEPDTLVMVNQLAVEPKMRPVYVVEDYIKRRKKVTFNELLEQHWGLFAKPVLDLTEIINLLSRVSKVKFDGTTVEWTRPL